MNYLFKVITPFIVLLMGVNLHAREISGIELPEQTQLAKHDLVLNGAGIRSKFIFDIYIGALYLPQKTHDIEQILNTDSPKRVAMHIIYSEVDKEKLTAGWTAGFENNLSEDEFNAIKPRLADFNQLFTTVKRGDKITLDYTPQSGTQVSINQQLKGIISGKDFYPALLKVWLGHDPADVDLKDGMLGN